MRMAVQSNSIQVEVIRSGQNVTFQKPMGLLPLLTHNKIHPCPAIILCISLLINDVGKQTA